MTTKELKKWKEKVDDVYNEMICTPCKKFHVVPLLCEACLHGKILEKLKGGD